ncbi:MAG: recombinase family protein [bacterium]|nr:recombinase family protein [bacterium]
MNEPIKAVGYIRVSTAEQEKEGLSLDAQRDQIETYAKLKNLRSLTILSDSVSGKNMKREGLQALLNHCDNGVKHVIVYKLDRLSRSTRDLLALIELFRERDITFHSITESIDTTTAQGRFFFTLMGALSALERELIGERTKEALRYKKEKGEWMGKPGLGYDVTNGIIVKNNSFPVLEKIRRLRRSGKYSYSQIAEVLNHEGYKSPGGKSFYASTVHYILKERHGAYN